MSRSSLSMATIRVRPVESKAKKDQMMDTDTTSESSLRSGVVIRIVVENNPVKQVPNSREKGNFYSVWLITLQYLICIS